MGPRSDQFNPHTASMHAGVRKHAHDSGDGETIYHCYQGETEFITRDGIKTFAETVGTTQTLLVNTGAGGVWVDAPILSFGEQTLWRVTLRRNQITKEIYATSDHRWLVRKRKAEDRAESRVVLTRDLEPEQRLSWLLPKSAIATSHPSQFGIAHGIVFGDGTRAALGCTVNLWGEKNAQLLRYFAESPQSVVKTAQGLLGVHVTGMPAFFKERPSIDESVPYLYGWLAGYFAADGSVNKGGQALLDCAKRDELEFVQTIATRLGIATYDIQERERQGYGDAPSKIYRMQFIGSTLQSEFFLIAEHRERYMASRARGNPERIGWTVVSVEETDRIEEVYCPHVHGHENFTLAGWINTMNCPMCGSGQVIARSDRSVECQFCHTCFTVQIQPQYPAFPQTINGQPVQVPGMPGQIQSGAPVGGDPAGGDPGFPVDPDDVDDQGGVPEDPQADDGQGGGDDDSADEQESEEDSAPPWAKKSLRTSAGVVLPAEEYIHHLAIKNARDRRTMAEIVRAGR